MQTTIQTYAGLDDRLLETLEAVDRGIFPEPLSQQTFRAELSRKYNLRVLLAVRDASVCGYKIGFEDSSQVYFSWSGGVLPAFRKQGIASDLMREQHRIARELGYSCVRTRTKNKYREMLILNIKNGFDVTGVYKNLGDKLHGIILEKSLG